MDGRQARGILIMGSQDMWAGDTLGRLVPPVAVLRCLLLRAIVCLLACLFLF